MSDIIGLYRELWPSNQRQIVAQMREMIARQTVEMEELWELMDRMTSKQRKAYLAFLQFLFDQASGKCLLVDENYQPVEGDEQC